MAKKNKRLDYFDAFRRQAELSVKEAKVLIDAIENYSTDEDFEIIMKKAHDIEHEGDEICHAIFTAIATDFITPIEREDIMGVAMLLDDILDYIEDVMQRFHMYNIVEMHKDALEFAKIIEKICIGIVESMDDFRNFKTSKSFRQRIIDINTLEEEADDLFMAVIRDMYVNKNDDPLYVLAWSELFARMERCTDAGEHVADLMRTIMLKNA